MKPAPAIPTIKMKRNSGDGFKLWMEGQHYQDTGMSVDHSEIITDSEDNDRQYKVWRVRSVQVKEKGKWWGKAFYRKALQIVGRRGWLAQDYLSGTSESAWRVWESLIRMPNVECKDIKADNGKGIRLCRLKVVKVVRKVQAAPSDFPKKCGTCGRVWHNEKEFMAHTKAPSGHKNKLQGVITRLCDKCGSTVMIEDEEGFRDSAISEPCGKCYSFANNFALKHPDATIAQGTVTHPWDKNKIAHAWAEWKGKVYDWQTIEARGKPPLSIKKFYELWKPQGVKKYTSEEAAIHMLKHKHHGPWTTAANRAGDPGFDHVPDPKFGKEYWTTYPDTGYLEKIRLLRYEGSFDQHRILKWLWLTGPEKGKEDGAYGRSFWKKANIESQIPTPNTPQTVIDRGRMADSKRDKERRELVRRMRDSDGEEYIEALKQLHREFPDVLGPALRKLATDPKEQREWLNQPRLRKNSADPDPEALADYYTIDPKVYRLFHATLSPRVRSILKTGILPHIVRNPEGGTLMLAWLADRPLAAAKHAARQMQKRGYSGNISVLEVAIDPKVVKLHKALAKGIYTVNGKIPQSMVKKVVHTWSMKELLKKFKTTIRSMLEEAALLIAQEKPHHGTDPTVLQLRPPAPQTCRRYLSLSKHWHKRSCGSCQEILNVR